MDETSSDVHGLGSQDGTVEPKKPNAAPETRERAIIISSEDCDRIVGCRNRAKGIQLGDGFDEAYNSM